MDTLKTRTLAGLSWSLLERVGIQIFQFIPTLFLARLLAPDQFGLIGMLALFIALATVFLDSGFGAALIQKKDVTHEDECSIFYFNIFVGVVCVVILYFAAPAIAAFFRQPVLIGLTRFLSLDILINAFSLIQTTLLTRKLDFKTQIKANVFGTLASGVIGVGAAYLGWGVWSLAVQTISAALLRTVALWLIHDWRPSLVFRWASLKGMFGFGSRLLASSLLGTFFDNFYQVFIGRVFSSQALGYFTRSASMRSIVIDTTSATIGRVLFPALASIQDDQDRLARAYRKSIILAVFVHFPLMLGLIVLARPLIILLFSARWEVSILYFQLMCGAGLFYPLHLINLDVLKVKGRTDLFFRLEVIKRGLSVVNILVTYRWGIAAILIGQIIVSTGAYFINGYYAKRLIGYALTKQVLDFAPTLAVSGLTAGAMALFGLILGSLGAVVFLAAVSLFGTAFYLGLQALLGSEALREILALAKGLKPAAR